MHPVQATKRAQDKSSVFEKPARSQVWTADLVFQQQDSHIPLSLNSISRHKRSTPKQSKLTSWLRLNLWPSASNVFLALQSLVWIYVYTHGISISFSKQLLILLCITKKQAASLFCPVLFQLLPPLQAPNVNVCLPQTLGCFKKATCAKDIAYWAPSNTTFFLFLNPIKSVGFWFEIEVFTHSYMQISSGMGSNSHTQILGTERLWEVKIPYFFFSINTTFLSAVL